MTKIVDKAETVSFTPSPRAFRNIYKINVSEHVIDSAEERYTNFKETTVFATLGFKSSDTVSIYTARSLQAAKHKRERLFLQYGQSLKHKYNPVFETDTEPNVLPPHIDDRLKLFAAFVILNEPLSKTSDAETVRMQQLQNDATQMILDLYPNTAFIHGRIVMGGHAQLTRLGVCKIKSN